MPVNDQVDIYYPTTRTRLVGQVEEAFRNASPGNARWMDQKVTYDNLHLVASVVSLSAGLDQPFSRFTLQESNALDQVLRREYGKPGLKDEMAKNEYDKFLLQPLCTLAYAGVLDSELTRKRMFKVKNRDLLDEIAESENSARSFLILYLETVLKEWGFWNRFASYFDSDQTAEDFANLKKQFQLLMFQRTSIGGRGSKNPEVEINRIFTKVLNPLAFAYGAHGTERGRVMKTIPSKFDLIYNRPNFFDAIRQKPRDITRRQFEAEIAKRAAQFPEQKQLSAEMRKVRAFHAGVSEVPTATGGKATHVHHIFPKSTHPTIADSRENMICITAAQHFFEAHPDGNTGVIDPTFQRIALLYKLETVRASVEGKDGMYSFDGLADVLASGYKMERPEASYDSCRRAIQCRL